MIKCALNRDELEFVYGLTKQSIQAKLDAGNPFNVDSYMKYLYERIQKVADKDRAAQFLAFTPNIVEAVVLNNFTENLDQIEGYDKISMLKAKWADPKYVIDNVINLLEQTKSNLKLARLINQQSIGVVQNNNTSKFDYNTVTRYKAINVLSTTLPSFIPGATKFQKEEPDSERRNINKVISNIAAKLSIEDTVTKYPNYQGVDIRLKAVNLGQFANNTVYSAEKLDTITQKQIARSLDIQNPLTKGKPKEGVDQVQDRVIVLITDTKGNPLSFDASGNIVSESAPNSKYAYQMMRSIRKTGNNFTVTDIFGVEQKVLSSQDIAAERVKDPASGLNYNDALKQVNAEFQEYYNIRNKALDEDVMLDIIGMTDGISIERTSKEATINDLSENGVVDLDKALPQVRTLTTEEAGIAEGRAVIPIDGEIFQLERPRMTVNLANQIVEVLFDKKLSQSEKVDFFEQFIPNKYIKPPSKRHDIVLDKATGDILITVYNAIKSKKYPQNVLANITIKSDGTIESTTEVEQAKQIFINALHTTFPDGKAMFINYSKDLFDKPFDLQLYKDGKLSDSENYIEFIKEFNPIVYITSTEEGFYNKQILFQNSNPDNQLNNITQSLPLNERFKQLEEEQYLADLLLKQTPDGKSVLKDEYKGKLIYSTLGLFSPESFKDTDVIHTNEITVDLIPSIQMGNGEVFRPRNENESVQDYIFAFSKSGYKTYYLDPAVKNRIKQLTEQGVTVITETTSKIQDSDLVVLGDRNNPAVISYNLNDKFFKKELDAAATYIENLSKEPKSKRVSPYVNKQIVKEQAGKVDTDKPSDPNQDWELLRSGKLNADKLTAKDIQRANDFWFKSPFGKSLQKVISLNKAANLVNSDAYANFVVSAVTLANPNIKGTININNSKGSMVDVYHEAFHAFTQLYLSPAEKIALYEEVLNFTDKNGNKPYEGKSYEDIEEILAEDFRTYMKNNAAKPNSPMRNSLFRKIVEMIQRLLGKIIPSLKAVKVDVMSVPTVKELFENLNFGNDTFFNQYEASVDNARFYELERGITYAEKINNESYKRTALSKQDSDLVSSSIDSIISQLIDERYDAEMKNTDLKGPEREAFESKVKGLNLSTLLSKKSRPITYKKVLAKLKDRLAELNAQYNESVGKKGISKITTFEELQNAAVATLETKSGINKYVILKSQIDSYRDFDSYFKRGSRIKGEEWKGIKIYGDYFTHSTIKDNSREGKPEVPAQIIVVSRIEDAEAQYNSYKKGRSKEYTGFKLNEDAVDSDLTFDQENILDNIRILETAIDQFGDPDYIIKGEKPTGVIAYHTKNSNYKIENVEYVLEDEVQEVQDGDPSIFEEPFQKSLLDLADKETIYILKSLSKIENGVIKKNKLGFNESADFRKVWNTLSKVIGGVQDRQEMFDIIKEESKNFPELEQLWKKKLAAPNTIASTFAFDVSSSFFQTFSRPSVRMWQLTTNITKQYNTGNLESTKVEFVTNESTIELNKILSTFESRFRISKNKYMVRLQDQPARLDVAKLYNTLIGDSKKLDNKDRLEFLNVLGFKLDNTRKLQEALSSKETAADINNLVLLTKDIKDILDKANKTAKEKAFIRRFSLNPIATLRDSDYMKGVVKILPSFKSSEILRSNSIVTNLGKLQGALGFDTPGETIKMPNGNNAYTVANHSSATSIILGLNALSDLRNAYKPNHHLSFLNPYENADLPYNPLALRNKILRTMFPNGTKRDTSKEMEFILLGGTEVLTKDVYVDIHGSEIKTASRGVNTSDLSARDKLFQAYTMMLQKGVGEFIRHSDKKNAFGIKLPKRKKFNGVSTGTNEDLWIDIDLFKDSKGDEVALEAFILDYIASEFDRIQYFEQNEEILNTTVGYSTELSNGRKAGLSFIAMDSLLPEDVKTFLYKQAKDPDVTDIIDVIYSTDTNMPQFPNIYKKIKEGVAEYFKEKSEFIKDSLGTAMKVNDEFSQYDTNTLAKAFTYNDFINRLEMSNLINGDLAQFKDFTKRVPGSTSDGDGFLSDKGAQDFVNNILQYKSKDDSNLKITYAQYQNIDDFIFDGTLNTGVIKDPKRKSIYLKDMLAAWEADYRKARPKLTEAEISYRLSKDAEAYEKMEEADGAAYLTIDAYRVLRKLGNKWSIEQENLYQDIIAGNDVNSVAVSKFFPVYKLHNYGALMNQSRIATTSMYKFAVAPIIPSIAVKGTELYNLHRKMMESGIQMVTFKSGSKASSITSKPTTKNLQADDIFEKVTDQPGDKLNTTDKYVEIDNEKAPIAINKIHLKYLKDVTSVADELKNSITVGTQSRVIVESQLYARGELINKKNSKLAREYRDTVDSLTDVLEKQLLNEIGFTIDKNGKYVPNDRDSLGKLTRVIRQELDAKGSPVQLQNIIDVTLDGTLKVDFSIHPEAQVVEQILVNRISKAISVQKTKGESDVQVPSTFYNGVWSSQFEKDEAIRKNDEKIAKLLGTNNLPFYRRGKNETFLAKVAIPLNGDFLNLLNLEDPDDSTKKIGTRKRLNELLKDEDWMKEHGDKVTITGPRIPTDDTNLIEGFEIWHFIDASAGSTAVVPTEIVAKAGSDFDVDKLFFSFPNINEDGSLPQEVPDFEKELAKRIKNKKGVQSLLNRQKRFIQNKLIKKSVEILKLPELYGALTKPANTYLFKREAKPESESYKKVHASLKENPTKFFEYEYNNNQHGLLMGGAAVVGLGAKKNKQHILNKSIGAKMPLKYLENDMLLREMKVRFTHNKMKGGNISLSHEHNVDGVSISEILSHGLQGILDRGNDDFPVRAGMTKEAAPILFRLIEVGVSLPQAVQFVQQPMIQEYLSKVQRSKGPLAELEGANLSKGEIIDRMVKPYINNTDVIRYYNTKSLTDAKNAMKANPSLTFTIFLLNSKEPVKIKGGDFVDFAKRLKLKVDQIQFIGVQGLGSSYENVLYAPYNPKNPNLKYKTYHFGEYFWEKAYGSSVPTADELKNRSSDKDANLNQQQRYELSQLRQVALFLEFLNIENQFQGMENFEINFNPDTGLLMNLEGAISRKRFVESIKEDSRVDTETIDRYLTASIISSMYKTNIFEDIVSPRFPLRLDKNLSGMLASTYKSKKAQIESRFDGNNSTEILQKYTNAFNNGVIDYIYQNILSHYVDTKTGLPVTLPKEIRSRKVNKKVIKGGMPVVFKEDTVDIDVSRIKKDYKNGNFISSITTEGLDTFEASPFSTFASYLRYVIEREYFRYTYKQFENVEGFEQRISKRALASSFNPGYIKGNAGWGSIKYSYTRDIMEFIEDPANATIVENFPVLQHLKPSFYKASSGYQLLELDNKTLIDNDTAEDYAKQIRRLGDPSFRIVPEDKLKDDMITDLFRNFSLMMIYQHGTGKSGLSFIKALNPEPFVQVLKETSISFQKGVLLDKVYKEDKDLVKFKRDYGKREAVFEGISDAVLDVVNFKQYLVEPSEYLGEVKSAEQRDELRSKNIYESMSNETLYRAYKDAIANRTYDDAMSGDGLGTSLVTKIEAELERRGLPSMLTANVNTTITDNITFDYSKSWSDDLRNRAVYTDEGVNTMRTSADPTGEENFGNPFSGPDGGGLMKLESVGDAVKAYEDWLLNDYATTDAYNIDPKEFVKAIIKSYGGKPTSKGLLTIDGQHYYIPNISIIPKGGFSDAFIMVGDQEIYLGQSKDGKNFASEDSYYLSDLAINKREWILGEIYLGNLDNKTLLYDKALADRGEGTHAESLANVVRTMRNNTTVVKPGIEIKREALSKKEQLELFSILKPFIEEQAAKTNKGKDANVMLGLELRWDYISNNPGVKPVDIGPIISEASKSKFGYYTASINGKPLGKISARLRELMTKATGVDTTNYDGAIINLYTDSTFVSSHNDVDESIEAIKYPVLVANIGGSGNFAVTKESDTYIKDKDYDVQKDMHTLNAGDAYIFGINGKNRKVYHRTFPTLQNGFLPEITTKIDGKTYEEGSYRISITLRRVKPLKGTNVPVSPKILSPTESANQVIIEGLGQTRLQFDAIDPVLETFYAGLTAEQSENPNLPTIGYAQEFYNTAPHAYKNINEYIEALKCL